jgi:hypothetical protein
MASRFPNGKGKLSDAPTAEALGHTFIKLIPNIYEWWWWFFINLTYKE